MTYNVFSGMLNPTESIILIRPYAAAMRPYVKLF